MSLARRMPVVAWGFALVFCAFWLSRQLVVTTDLSAFLPEVATPTQAQLVGQLRDGVASRLVLMGIDGGDATMRVAASKALARELASDARFTVVANGDPRQFARELALVQRWRYLLSPQVSADRFTVQGLRDALNESLRLLASPMGPAIRGTIGSDPTGEVLHLLPAFAGGTRNVQDGIWLSPDGQRALVSVATRAPGFDLDAQEASERAIREAFARVADPALTLRLASPGLLAVESRRQIQHDAALASTITLVGVLLLLTATYRSAWPVALSALPALSGLAAGVVAVSLAFGPVHAITLGFGAMLVGEAIDYPTYLFANNATAEDLVSTQARIGPTLLLAAATTACGALAMLLSGFRGLAQLGLLIVTGVAVAGLVTRYVLPDITPARALVRKRAALPLDTGRMLAGLRRHRWLAIAAMLAAVVLLAVKRDGLWDDDLANLNPVSAAIKLQDRELRDAVGAPDLRYLVVASGADREQAIAASERVASVLDTAVAQRWIGGYDLVARYLPSMQAQRKRQGALPEPAALRAALDEALEDLPFRSDVFEPFLQDVERTRTGPLLQRADLEGSAFALKADALLVENAGRWSALLPLTGVDDPAAVAGLLAASKLPDVSWLDLKGEADALVAGYRAQSLRSTLLGLAAIAVVVFAGVRSIAMTLRLLAPVLGAVLLTAAILVAAGERLTVFHLVAMLLVVGVGLNYALFFGRAQASREERDLTFLSVIVASAATLIASISLAATGTPVLRAIGLTTGIGTLCAFAVSAMLSRDHS